MQKFLIEINTQDIEEISRLAGLFFTPAEIATMLEIEKQNFVEACLCDDGNEFFRAFMGGRLQGEIDLRTGIMKMAKAGSSPAQTMALDMLRRSKLNLKDNG